MLTWITNRIYYKRFSRKYHAAVPSEWAGTFKNGNSNRTRHYSAISESMHPTSVASLTILSTKMAYKYRSTDPSKTQTCSDPRLYADDYMETLQVAISLLSVHHCYDYLFSTSVPPFNQQTDI
ncbi:hypothetical protein MtrunA17_Chr8g0374131 [Medicago truncatula]|uniref:Uncharacterized protein n=1 Tax=Medicago truncatula TaxID=3880 RepID=A0A072TSU4_MEDTR|nr:hypothetical protein MTR_8g079110 [Medicago truncatula]RHN42186.1 hypothetical protein MtrunA17_Chr8g0374131 [Medicago truncatula]